MKLILLSMLVLTVQAQAQEPGLPISGGALRFEERTEDDAPPQPGPPFRRVVEAGDTIYLAGHLGRNPETGELPKGIEAQTEQTLKNIGATLASVNAGYGDVVRCQVFLDNIKDFAAMNGVYRTFFPVNPPARTTVAVEKLAINAKIEIECTAVRGFGNKSDE